MFGSHLSISGGMENALLAAEKLNLKTVQVFTKNQQQWAAKPLDPAAIKLFRSHADRLNFHHIVAHASYLINLAAIDDALWQKSIASFAHEMERCDDLGIAYLVIHPGAHCGSGEQRGIARVTTALNQILDQQKNGKVTVCLETTAGQGSCLGCTFEHLAEMRNRITHKDRIGICVDTCHILAAGYDITTTASTHAVLEQLNKIIGLDHVKVWHLNDSKKPLASRVDRHEHIGRGHVGLPAFQIIAQHPQFQNTPKILETPKDPAPDGRDWDEVNLELLRAFAAGKNTKLISFPDEASPLVPPNGLATSRPTKPKKAKPQ